MEIGPSNQNPRIYKGRAYTVSAVGASFTMNLASDTGGRKIQPTFTGIQPLSGKAASEYAANLTALEEEEFKVASEIVTLSNITKTGAISPFKNNMAAERSAAILNIEADPDEDLVLLEFNPATGQIMDWYQPVLDSKPFDNSTMPLIKTLEDGIRNPRRQVTFEIPLHATYSSDPEAYGPMKSLADLNPKALSKKMLQVFSIKNLERMVHKATARILEGPVKWIDKRIVKDETLGMFKADGPPTALTPDQKKKLKGERALLFVHGIISSTTGAFGGIQEDMNFYKKLSDLYNGNLLAYDHWTLSKDIFENAQELSASLPQGISIDIVCHSRGAGVVRSLLEKNIQKLKDKKIEVRKVVFVAGACEGSQLATGRALDNIFKTLNKFGVLLGKSSFTKFVIVKALKLILGGLQEVPGTDSMDPEGKYITSLKESKRTRAKQYNYFRANFDPGNSHIAAIDQKIIDEAIFLKKGNDVVVPFEGAGISKNYLEGKVEKKLIKDYGSDENPQENIWHITFFDDKSMRNLLLETLSEP